MITLKNMQTHMDEVYLYLKFGLFGSEWKNCANYVIVVFPYPLALSPIATFVLYCCCFL